MTQKIREWLRVTDRERDLLNNPGHSSGNVAFLLRRLQKIRDLLQIADRERELRDNPVQSDSDVEFLLDQLQAIIQHAKLDKTFNLSQDHEPSVPDVDVVNGWERPC